MSGLIFTKFDKTGDKIVRMNKSAQIKFPVNETVLNYKTKKECKLVSCEDVGVFGEADIEKIAAICNQKSVYDILFRDKFGGKEYDSEKAVGFFNWAASGWRTQKYFVFLVRNSGGEIIGAVDIKSNDLEGGEIGYWADENNPGVMTNAVSRLAELAKNAGYKKLFALVLKENTKSQNVLGRNGFVWTGSVQKPEGERQVFEKIL